MFKISALKGPKTQTLMFEGRLTGPWVAEAERAWIELVEETGCRRLLIDLSGLTFVDDEGKDLLGRIFEQGGELQAADVMSNSIIEEIRLRYRRVRRRGFKQTRQDPVADRGRGSEH